MRRYYRIKSGLGFYYQDSAGQRVGDKATLDYIKLLVIPPAWTDVVISDDPNAKIMATGYDKAGRKQYVYNPKFRQEREREKFDRILAFAHTLPMMRRITNQHLRDPELDRHRVLACMVRLIDQAYFRVGNERYAEENHTYGLTTLQPRHLHIEGDRLIFHYMGKAHKEQTSEVVDERLARIVREVDHLPGYEIFKYYDADGELVHVNSEDLNTYIKEIMGYDFSAKDFRTWAGTLIAAVALAEMDHPHTKTQQKQNIVDAVKTVAEKLGNTPAIAKASYIDPRIIDHYLSGQTIRSYLRRIKNLDEEERLATEEVAVLKLLKRRLKAKLAG